MKINLTVILSVLTAVGLIITAFNNYLKSKKTTTITKSDWNRSREQLRELDKITDRHEVWINEIKSVLKVQLEHINKNLDIIGQSIEKVQEKLNARCPYHEKMESDIRENRETFLKIERGKNDRL